MTDIVTQVFAWVSSLFGNLPIPGWVAAVLAGLAFGLNLGSYIQRRKMLRLFDLWQYDDDAVVEMMDWCKQILAVRAAERKDREQDVTSCDCPQRPNADLHEDKTGPLPRTKFPVTEHGTGPKE